MMPRLYRMSDGVAGRTVANMFAVRLVGSTCAALLAALYVGLAVEDPQRRLVTLVMLAAVPLIEPFQAFATYWQSRNHNRPLFVARSGGLLARLALLLAALWLGAPLWVLALAWVLAQGDDMAPIPGTKRRAYLEENIAAATIKLTLEDLAALDAVLPPGAASGARYPERSLQLVNL